MFAVKGVDLHKGCLRVHKIYIYYEESFIRKLVAILYYIANEFTRRQWKLEQFLALQVFNLTSKS